MIYYMQINVENYNMLNKLKILLLLKMSQKCVIKFRFLGPRFDEEYLVVSDICQLNCELSNIIINLRAIC